MKIVLDSNVFLSGLAVPNSTPGRIISAWDNHCFDIVSCEFQLAEIARVMAYPKVKRLLRWGVDGDFGLFLQAAAVDAAFPLFEDLPMSGRDDPDLLPGQRFVDDFGLEQGHGYCGRK
jgi:hypothetical protein